MTYSKGMVIKRVPLKFVYLIFFKTGFYPLRSKDVSITNILIPTVALLFKSIFFIIYSMSCRFLYKS